ncbi:methylenetetrahydrofolate reductase [NAD(P)H] [Oscillospiraceae bacterium MB08-C2-2]|nr:methylenetetrahydrofolate reductase [NAD(P)H] [Oscillospiraceae bacterium MB08-C2-2]
MFIKDLFSQKKPVISFEVFPPKKAADIQAIYGALEGITQLGPDFISVTYGAGGSGSSGKTGEIASAIKNKWGIEALAHLTCVGARRDQIHQIAAELKEANVLNILALRGDLPVDTALPLSGDFQYAHDLIRELKELGGFCIGAACYPEGHIESDSVEESLLHLKEKQEAGADFLITQLFFENNLFFDFLEKARKTGITLPITAGVMPILSRGQIERMIFMCGSSLPSAIVRLLHKYADSPADLRKAGIEYASNQAEGLIRGGVDGVHLYSMNQPDIAAAGMERIRRVQQEI